MNVCEFLVTHSLSQWCAFEPNGVKASICARFDFPPNLVLSVSLW